MQTVKISQISMGVNEALRGSYQQNGMTFYMATKPVNGLGDGRENWAYQNDTADSDSDVGSGGDDATARHLQRADEEKRMTSQSGTHSIVLDVSTTNFADMVTVKTLKNVRVSK